MVQVPLAVDFALVAALQSGHPGAREALFDRYGSLVRCVLLRILGPDPDLRDLLHDVFVAAFESVHRLDDPARLRSWITSIAVFTARARIRRRSRFLGWLTTRGAVEAERTADPPDTDSGEAARAVYAVLGRMSEDERVCFSLRFLMGMEIGEVAEASGVSHSTAKRRVAAARKRFEELAAAAAPLRPWLKLKGDLP